MTMPLSGSPLPRGERTDAEQLPSAIAIPDGYNPRRLPILVAPRDDETAPSWLRRFGHRYGLTARALLRELGIPTSAWSPTRVSAHIAEHSDLIVDTVGLPDERARYLRAGLISEAVSAFRTHWERHGKSSESMPLDPSYCPECLAQQGYWNSTWSLPLHRVCVEHAILMPTNCPRCAETPWAGTSWPNSTDPNWACPQRDNRPRTPRTRHAYCGHDLRDVEFRRVAPEIVEAQVWILELARGASEPSTNSFGGQRFSTREYFDAALTLGKPIMSCQAASDPDAACLEQLLKVKSILCEEDVYAAHSLAVEQSVLTPGTWLLRDGRDLPRSRTNAVIGHLAITPLAEKLSPTAQLTFRVASGCARYPTAHEIPGNHIPLSSIPQVHWTGFRDYTTAKDRAVLSMLLARSGTARPWGHIAFALGLPHEFSRYPPLLIRQIKRSGEWTDTLDQIESQTRELLTGPPPIDYHRRRLQLANPDLTISIARILSTSRTFRAVTPHALAVAIWEVYTGGAAEFATESLYSEDSNDGDLSSARNLVREQWSTIRSNSLLPDLGFGEEPLEWRPP